MSKLIRAAGRTGKAPVSVYAQFIVHRLHIDMNGSEIPVHNWFIRILRGSKSKNSKCTSWSDGEAKWGDLLSLPCTMFLNQKTKCFQSKLFVIEVVHEKKTIATFEVDMSTYVKVDGKSKSCIILPSKKCHDMGATLSVS